MFFRPVLKESGVCVAAEQKARLIQINCRELCLDYVWTDSKSSLLPLGGSVTTPLTLRGTTTNSNTAAKRSQKAEFGPRLWHLKSVRL